MTSKIKVDNITNQSDSNIVNKCGTTITLGASGDTIELASGASQTGFGRTGTVDWDTTPKTASFTAVSGDGYFVNTTSGALTMTLPASPSAGDIVAVADYTRTFATNNLTIGRNSESIGGISNDGLLNINGQSATFIYVDGTEGWINTQETQTSQTGNNPFVCATGGTITECGDFKIHTFTGPGTFTVNNISGCTPARNTVGYQVVAGGGGGGFCVGGGGGGGGYREGRNVPIDNFTASPLVANAPTNAVTLTETSYPITVGAGGISGVPAVPGGNGNNSVFSTITSAGGGGGGTYNSPILAGGNGGSGGGGAGWNNPNPKPGGSGNTPPVSPSQGNNGGAGPPSSQLRAGGGGGGAGGTGSNSPPDLGPVGTAAPGGAGVSSSITGASATRSAGGQGSNDNTPTPGTAGTANSGNGGFGAGAPTPAFGANGGTGGSGIVIIRYKFQ